MTEIRKIELDNDGLERIERVAKWMTVAEHLTWWAVAVAAWVAVVAAAYFAANIWSAA